MAEAIIHSESGGTEGGPPFAWDLAINVGDMSGAEGVPQDEEGAEVVLKGRLTPDGGFHTDPNGILAKCPSKYEEQKVAKKVG